MRGEDMKEFDEGVTVPEEGDSKDFNYESVKKGYAEFTGKKVVVTLMPDMDKETVIRLLEDPDIKVKFEAENMRVLDDFTADDKRKYLGYWERMQYDLEMQYIEAVKRKDQQAVERMGRPKIEITNRILGGSAADKLEKGLGLEVPPGVHRTFKRSDEVIAAEQAGYVSKGTVLKETDGTEMVEMWIDKHKYQQGIDAVEYESKRKTRIVNQGAVQAGKEMKVPVTDQSKKVKDIMSG
jgi:hypothetical protein